LELIRYIHLNPLRADLVNNLRELDRYRWCGHSAVLGKRKNPLIPHPPNEHNKLKKPNKPSEAGKPLAEKTIEDILLLFGDNLGKARARYRHFIKQGVDQGSRPELLGGGLVRSAGGDKRGLLGRKKGERELSDERILGSGDFVANVMKDAKEALDQRAKFDISLVELISRVCTEFGIRVKDLVSKSRKRQLSQARGVVCYLAVDELGYSGDDVARRLRISGRGVSDCRERGKKILDNSKIISEYLM
jgi:hypothetical protein